MMWKPLFCNIELTVDLPHAIPPVSPITRNFLPKRKSRHPSAIMTPDIYGYILQAYESRKYLAVCKMRNPPELKKDLFDNTPNKIPNK